MEILHDRDLKNRTFSSLSIALGNFDGVHRGHEKIIKQAMGLAEKRNSKSLIFTFYPHPLHLLKGDKAPKLIYTLEDKVEIIRKLGPDYLFIKEFSKDFAKIDHHLFVHDYLYQTFRAVDLVVGRDFSFGNKGLGSVSTLLEMEKKYGFKVRAQEMVEIQGIPVKSTYIRKLITRGEIKELEEFLGRPYSLSGTVVKGYGRGRMLGFPTANINPSPQLITPPEGVYVVEVHVDKEIYPGVANIGFCPTFKGNFFSIEVHLLGFYGDLYQEKIKLIFLQRLRDEIAFASKEDLQKRVELDMLRAKEILEARFPYLNCIK